MKAKGWGRIINIASLQSVRAFSNSGPYAAYLQIATALEYPAMHAIPELCASNDIDIADVNRTLLRVLSQARTT